MSRKRNKLFKITFSAAGLTALILFAAALLFAGYAVLVSFRTYGHGGNTVAVLGFLALILTIGGVIIPLHDRRRRKKEEGMPLLSKIALICNGAGLAGMIAVYVIGIIV